MSNYKIVTKYEEAISVLDENLKYVEELLSSYKKANVEPIDYLSGQVDLGYRLYNAYKEKGTDDPEDKFAFDDIEYLIPKMDLFITKYLSKISKDINDTYNEDPKKAKIGSAMVVVFSYIADDDYDKTDTQDVRTAIAINNIVTDVFDQLLMFIYNAQSIKTKNSQKMFMENIGYRNNEISALGSSNLKAKEVIEFEIEELGNIDIIEYMDESFNLKSPEEYPKFFESFLDTDNPYAYWFATKEVVETEYDGNEDNITKYILPEKYLVISDMEDGMLIVSNTKLDDLEIDIEE